METIKKVYTKTYEDWKEDEQYLRLGTANMEVSDFHADMMSMPIDIISMDDEKVTFTTKSK
ncbi:hypothetical protein DYU11_20100 [Fibrisoma montanum]|uniref:Uncharacterized protein n=1 Tax=Fibrisoma montanum TaxID=2305895 RepID=A0A418M3F4_9BACT|nr:hypothetical protein [Fibrisoma montanum]RIV20356.1 hypothetical protein DYU11_20100 [Fibrisoma montanum]